MFASKTNGAGRKTHIHIQTKGERGKERERKRETMNTPRKYLFEEKFSHKRFFNRKISLEIIVKKRGNIQQNKTKEIDVFL